MAWCRTGAKPLSKQMIAYYKSNMNLSKNWTETQMSSLTMMTSSNGNIFRVIHYWLFVWGIHQSPVNSPHKGQWRGALMFSLICIWINGWVKHSWGWWYVTLPRPLWRHCNDSLRQSDAYALVNKAIIGSDSCRVACSAPSHYLNQCWLVVITGNKSQWSLGQNTKLCLQDNIFENVVSKMMAILSWPQYVKKRGAWNAVCWYWPCLHAQALTHASRLFGIVVGHWPPQAQYVGHMIILPPKLQ